MIGPLAATAFLTRLRVPGSARTIDDVARAEAWFAAVGLLIGALLVAIDRLAMRAFPPTTVDILLVVALVLITGALHLDGLADTADGFLGGGDRERRLEIMHDVHAGTYAVAAIACVLLLKVAGLAALPSGVRVEALLLVPCLARFAMVVVIASVPYARGTGLGSGFRAGAWPRGLLVSGATALVAAVALVGWSGPGLVAVAALIGGMIAWVSWANIGGATGDVYGATVELTEAALLLTIAAGANRGWIEAWTFA